MHNVTKIYASFFMMNSVAMDVHAACETRTDMRAQDMPCAHVCQEFRGRAHACERHTDTHASEIWLALFCGEFRVGVHAKGALP